MAQLENVAVGMPADYLERQSQDPLKRILELELQVHALTAAVQHLLTVTKPLVEIAEAASQQGRIVLE